MLEQDALYRAAEIFDVVAVRQLCSLGSDELRRQLSFRDGEGDNALHYAVYLAGSKVRQQHTDSGHRGFCLHARPHCLLVTMAFACTRAPIAS